MDGRVTSEKCTLFFKEGRDGAESVESKEGLFLLRCSRRSTRGDGSKKSNDRRGGLNS
jgi:hypothetical protein